MEEDIFRAAALSLALLERSCDFNVTGNLASSARSEAVLTSVPGCCGFVVIAVKVDVDAVVIEDDLGHGAQGDDWVAGVKVLVDQNADCSVN